jgi:hypothetical protein
MVYFQTKNPKLGKVWKIVEDVGIFYDILSNFTAIWYILCPPSGIVYVHLAYFVVIWYISHNFGIVCQEKSGNPGWSGSG